MYNHDTHSSDHGKSPFFNASAPQTMTVARTSGTSSSFPVTESSESANAGGALAPPAKSSALLEFNFNGNESSTSAIDLSVDNTGFTLTALTEDDHDTQKPDTAPQPTSVKSSHSSASTPQATAQHHNDHDTGAIGDSRSAKDAPGYAFSSFFNDEAPVGDLTRSSPPTPLQTPSQVLAAATGSRTSSVVSSRATAQDHAVMPPVVAIGSDAAARSHQVSPQSTTPPQPTMSAQSTPPQDAALARHGATSARETVSPWAPSGQPGGEDEALQSNLFICGLAPSIRDPELISIFSTCGEVESAKVMLDIHTGQSRCIAFVKFKTVASAELAIAQLNGKVLHQHQITVRVANSRAAYLPGVPTNKAFIRNVPPKLTADVLKQYFNQFGEVTDISIHADTAQSRLGNAGGAGLARHGEPKLNIVFVTFTTTEAAVRTVAETHTKFPFPECNNIPLLAKVAEDSARRVERLARRFRPGHGAAGGNQHSKPATPQPAKDFPAATNLTTYAPQVIAQPLPTHFGGAQMLDLQPRVQQPYVLQNSGIPLELRAGAPIGIPKIEQPNGYFVSAPAAATPESQAMYSPMYYGAPQVMLVTQTANGPLMYPASMNMPSSGSAVALNQYMFDAGRNVATLPGGQPMNFT